jgi:hypothetical protein
LLQLFSRVAALAKMQLQARSSVARAAPAASRTRSVKVCAAAHVAGIREEAMERGEARQHYPLPAVLRFLPAAALQQFARVYKMHGIVMNSMKMMLWSSRHSSQPSVHGRPFSGCSGAQSILPALPQQQSLSYYVYHQWVLA